MEKITAVHDIKIENFVEKLLRKGPSESGFFYIQINDTKEEGNSNPGINVTWMCDFRYLNLSVINMNPEELPMVATCHILRNETKVWTSNTLREVLGKDIISLFDSTIRKEIKSRMQEFVDENGSLTIRLEVNLLPCCLSVTGKRKAYEGLKDTPVTKKEKIQVESFKMFSEEIASMRNKFCDLTITCQGKNFPVHRAFLSARSEVSIIQ